MSAASHEIMSLAQLTRRLSEVRQGEEHLKAHLPLGSAHNATLRLSDIIAYTGIPYEWIRRQFPDMYRIEQVSAGTGQVLRVRGRNQTDKPVCKEDIEERQTALSRFFYGWDRGTLLKARVGNEWRICNRFEDPAAVAPAPWPPSDARMIGLSIDPATLGLKVKPWR